MKEWLKANRDIVLILFVALVVRLSLVSWLHEMGGYTGDETEYISLAKSVAEGKPFVDSNGEWATKAPLYPFVMSLCFRVSGTNLFVPHVLNVLFGTATVFFGFILCLRLFHERRVALIAASAMALYPGLVIYSDILQTEAMYVVLLLLVLLKAEELQSRPTMSGAAMLGVVAGMANLTRAVLTGFVPLLLIVIGWLNRDRLGIIGGKIILATVVWCLVLAPWTWRNYRALNAFVPVSSWGGMSLLLGNNPHATGTWKPKPEFERWFAQKAGENGIQLAASTEIQRSELGRKLALEFWQTEPGETVKLAVKKLYMYSVYPITNTDSFVPLQLAAVAADVVLYLFAGIGFLGTAKRRPLLPVVVAIVVFSLIQAVMHSEARYRLPVMPLVAMFSASGAGMLLSTQRREDFVHTKGNVMLACLWCIAVGGVYTFTAWQFFTGEI